MRRRGVLKLGLSAPLALAPGGGSPTVPESLARRLEWFRDLKFGLCPDQPAEALADSSAVIVATPYADAVDALKSLGPLDGKVIIDATNPLSADFMSLMIGHTTSAAEEIAKAFPKAEVVKAFNTVFAQVIADKPAFQFGQTAPVFVASDSERAKQVAKTLIHSIGFNAVDAGPLRNARYLEPETLGGEVDLVVVDASFIGVEKLLPGIVAVLRPGGTLVALVKPQFEAGKAEAARTRGVIRDPEVRARAIAK